MEASEYLINCLKMSQKNRNSLNITEDIEEVIDENKAGNSNSFILEEQNHSLVINLIENIKKKEEMDKALFELSKQRENFKDIAVYIFYSTGTMSIL